MDLWIAHQHPDIRSSDKARKRKRLAETLEKRRIMVNQSDANQRLASIGNPTKQEIIEESARVFEVLKPLGHAALSWCDFSVRLTLRRVGDETQK